MITPRHPREAIDRIYVRLKHLEHLENLEAFVGSCALGYVGKIVQVSFSRVEVPRL